MYSGLSEAKRLITKLETNEKLPITEKLAIINIYTKLGYKAVKELDEILGGE